MLTKDFRIVYVDYSADAHCYFMKSEPMTSPFFPITYASMYIDDHRLPNSLKVRSDYDPIVRKPLFRKCCYFLIHFLPKKYYSKLLFKIVE